MEKAPFYETNIIFDNSRSNEVVMAVKNFAARHRMDFISAQKSLPLGDLNASADGPEINLKAIHIEGFDSGVNISAIARGDPTADDRALVDEFVADVQRAGRKAPR